jgi:hypothetical protein
VGILPLRTRAAPLLLILGFLGILFGLPAAQIAVELHRGERVQFTDLFRYAPTGANLRRFEATLEDTWWGQRTVRPWMQRLEFLALRNAGAKALIGRNGWVFYRPDVRYLIEADRPEPDDGSSIWAEPAATGTRRDSVARAIVQYRDQLRERGMELLVVPVPSKASVYPDELTLRAEGMETEFRSPTEELLTELRRRDVQTVDLFALFRDARRKGRGSSTTEAYYLATDTHWTPAGARLAAEAVARKLRDLESATAGSPSRGHGWRANRGTLPIAGNGHPTHRREYSTRRVRVARHGDILEMTEIPGIRDRFSPEVVECEQVLDPRVGPMVPGAGGRDGTYANSPLRDTPRVLVLGDSFCRIYQLPEPQSLGEVVDGTPEPQNEGRQPVGRKRLLPGSAGFPSLLALVLKAPVDYIVSDGGAATDVRQRLSTNAEILENKKVVVWLFAEREAALGKPEWRPVPLPREL